MDHFNLEYQKHKASKVILSIRNVSINYTYEKILDEPGIYMMLPQNILQEVQKQFKNNFNEILSKEINDIQQVQLNDNQVIFKFQEQNDQEVNFQSFEVIQEIGEGAFGQVFLVKKKDTGQLYALKAQNKKNLILQNKIHYVFQESQILKQIQHPFIIEMYYCFQTPLYIYFILEYCPGIDLLTQIQKKGKFPEDQARFYITELLLAIQNLHEHNIIYRDLKPENILISSQGHVKLTDFGISKNLNNQDVNNIQSICGSPCYISPEMLLKNGAVFSTDIYGIGCILYELLIGQPPFYNYNVIEMFDSIKEGNLEFPSTFSPQAQDLIKKMMDINPENRIGANDIEEIKNHPFFEGIDWSLVLSQKYQPPIKPKFKQLQQRKKSVFCDFDYNDETYYLNRIQNLTYVADPFQFSQFESQLQSEKFQCSEQTEDLTVLQTFQETDNYDNFETYENNISKYRKSTIDDS